MSSFGRSGCFGCFGVAPFADLGQSIVQKLAAGTEAERPVVGVLKLTPEKGCSIVLELANRMPHLDFICVAGDPKELAHRISHLDFIYVAGDPKVEALFKQSPNVKIVEPQANIDDVLSRVWVVLAPSLWLEAWGMVVTEALLRGGLPEAGMMVCPRVDVNTIEIPTKPDTGTPCWADRVYPKQEVQPWMDTINALLEDPSYYRRISEEGRRLALKFVSAGPDQLDEFIIHLNRLENGTRSY
eukprot:gene6091-2686_t